MILKLRSIRISTRKCKVRKKSSLISSNRTTSIRSRIRMIQHRSKSYLKRWAGNSSLSRILSLRKSKELKHSWMRCFELEGIGGISTNGISKTSNKSMKTKSTMHRILLINKSCSKRWTDNSNKSKTLSSKKS